MLHETNQLSTQLSNLLNTLPPGVEPSIAAERDSQLAAQMLTLHHSINRNKRCLLAYHQFRMDWLKGKLWQRGGSLAVLLEERDNTGGTSASVTSSKSATSADGSKSMEDAVDPSSSSATLRSKLSPQELTWLREYSSLLTALKSEYLDLVDVCSPLSTSSSSSIAASGATAAMALDYAPPTDLMVTVVATRDARGVMTEMGALNLRRGERMRVKRAEVEALIVRGWLDVVDD